jgi:hypothetical protein
MDEGGRSKVEGGGFTFYPLSRTVSNGQKTGFGKGRSRTMWDSVSVVKRELPGDHRFGTSS